MPYGRVQVVTFGAPSDSQAGFAIGCLAHRLDGATGTTLYVNEGTAASSTWKAILTAGTNAAATFTTATITTLGSTTATITTLVCTAINAAAAAATFTVKGNTAAAVSVTDGTTSLYVQDTRNTVTVQNHIFDAPASQTLPNGATSRFRMVSLNAHTVTLAGQTQVTTTNQGATLFLGGATYAQSGGAVTVDQVSTLHVAVPVAGSSVTITANRHISTGVSDCYLTNTGVWTDTACWAYAKENLERAGDKANDAIRRVVDALRPATWTYRNGVHAVGVDKEGNPVPHITPLNDFGRERVGIVYDDLPEELRAPGEKRGVSAGLLSSFALAALKVLFDENRLLKERLSKLEGVAA